MCFRSGISFLSHESIFLICVIRASSFIYWIIKTLNSSQIYYFCLCKLSWLLNLMNSDNIFDSITRCSKNKSAHIIVHCVVEIYFKKLFFIYKNYIDHHSNLIWFANIEKSNYVCTIWLQKSTGWKQGIKSWTMLSAPHVSCGVESGHRVLNIYMNTNEILTLSIDM